jgi:TonB-dependent receptor
MSTRPLVTRLPERHPMFRLTHLAAACSFVLGGPALAQQAAGEPPAKPAEAAAAEPVETVVVTGIRRSLDTSLALKRNAQGVVDGIVAEDIGKFPDTNLAESMQRISGVSIDRSMGEGSKVTVRGIGPDFNLVLLNGRQMPASSIEATSASNSRAFDFANLASEAVSALEVYKTSRAATPAGGMGATINIKTARPLDNKGQVASFGVKAVYDETNQRLPESLRGDQITPEVSGIYSNTFADGMFGVSLSGSYQERHLAYNEAGVPGGWRTFRGDEGGWGTIPQDGQPGSERIENRPGPTDLYGVPQNLLYAVNAIQRKRTNGQLTLQFAPSKELVTTLDYTYSENKVKTRRNELSAWFNFGPSSSAWTDGPVAAPIFYSEIIEAGNSDVAMAGGLYATKNENHSVGLNIAWKPSSAFSLEFDAHSSSATSGADSPYGSNATIGTAAFNRGTTTVDFSNDFPVLNIVGGELDPSLMVVTGSSFRNSYMKSEIEQAQLRGQYKLEDSSRLDFGLSFTDVNNRTAYGFVQRDTWGGSTTPEQTPDNLWRADDMGRYFRSISGSNDPAFSGGFFTWDFDSVRDVAVAVSGDESLYLPPPQFTEDRRVNEKSHSAFVQYGTDWDLGNVPMSLTAGVRYEQTTITAPSRVLTATGVNWVGNNEFSLVFGEQVVTNFKGKYSYLLPSIDFDADLSSKLKFRASYGESIGRPRWDQIQGGQTLDQLARFGGGTGRQGNPGLKPLKSHNIDLSLEYYYAKSSYIAAGYFHKKIDNYIGDGVVQATPFNLNTPANGVLFQEAVSAGSCPDTDMTCIRNYIFSNYNGTRGVQGTLGSDGNWVGTIAGQPDDPILNFTISVPANTRSSTLQGVELNWQHMFGNSGFGVATNYTWVDSGLKYKNNEVGDQFALVGLSDTANLVAFYENDWFEARVAYNWRGEFLASVRDGAGFNPVYTEAFSQIDLSMGYKVNQNLSFQFEGINLNDATIRQHGRTKNQLVGVYQTGPRYMIGARYKF